MADENKSLTHDEVTKKNVAAKSEKKIKSKAQQKKPNFFVRIWKKLCKFCKDIKGEMKKVTWTSREELGKNTKLVLVTVVAVGVAVALVDALCSWIINSLAGLIG